MKQYIIHSRQTFSSLTLTGAEHSTATPLGREGDIYKCGLSKPWGSSPAGNEMLLVLQAGGMAERCGIA